jgi:hypothetical protein
MATKPVKLIVPISLLAILAVLIAILASRLLAPSTMTVENASDAEVTDVELRLMVNGTAVSHKIDRLSPGEKRTITLDLGSGDFPFVASYRQGPLKVNCDLGVLIRGRGEHWVLGIGKDTYEVVRE